jgi:4'-phosphopantetheinyl transferase
MIAGDTNNRVYTHFNSAVLDLTPSSSRHVATMLYVPVSNDAVFSELCASVLSKPELQRANRFTNKNEKTHFKQRRAFRRFCAAIALGSIQPLSQFDFEETENGRPFLSGATNFCFSFSSCRTGFLGAWSSTHGIGVDIEEPVKGLEANELARQYFSTTEANVVEKTTNLARQRTFFQFWCLKEAALKSIGEGLPFGLDSFKFGLSPTLQIIDAPSEHGGPGQFSAHFLERTEQYAALIIRSLI